MTNLKFLPLQFLLAYLSGTCFGFFFDLSPAPVFLTAVFLVVLLFVLHSKACQSFRPAYGFALVSTTFFALLGLLRMEFQDPVHRRDHYINHYTRGMPLHLRIKSHRRSSKGDHRFEAEIVRTGLKTTTGVIFLRILELANDRELNPGDLILTMEEPKAISSNRNPGGFDFRKYSKNRGVYHQLTIRPNRYRFLVREHYRLGALVNSVRQKLIESLERLEFGPEELAVIKALLLGERNDLNEELRSQYKKAGAMHILAVSGLHVGILMIFLNLAFKPLERIKKGSQIKFLLLLGCLWWYALLAGLSASVVRAATMCSILVLGKFLKDRSQGSNSVVTSLFLLLLIQPMYLFDPGFQLSYAAVIGIIWLTPVIAGYWAPRLKTVRYFWQLVAVSCGAQLGILPLILYYFKAFSGLFLISSLILIPVLGFILGTGFVVMGLSLLGLIPGEILATYGTLITVMNDFVETLSEQEAFIFEQIYFTLPLALALLGLILALARWLRVRSPTSTLVLCLAVIALQLTALFEKRVTAKRTELVIFHQHKSSMISYRQGHEVVFYRRSEDSDDFTHAMMKNYSLTGYDSRDSLSAFRNLFLLYSKIVLVMDHAEIGEKIDIEPDLLVLCHAPKINLERYLKRHRPEVIVADGSNYASFIDLWQKTCEREGIPFHSTYCDGAFIYDFKP